MLFVKQQIRSYLHLRHSILQKMIMGELSANKIIEVLGCTRNIYTLRRRKPDTWTLDEIEQLALHLGYSIGTIQTIKKLTALLNLLTPQQQQQLCRVAKLNRNKLQVRQKNHNNWKIHELELLALALERCENKAN
jgi:hypothetical protein